MKSKFNTILNFIKRIGFFIPFTWYFVLFLAAGWLGIVWLHKQESIPDSAFADIFTLLLRFAKYFCLAILLFAFLSTVGSLLYFVVKKRRKGIDFWINIPSGNETQQAKQPIEININPILKPLLGFIKLRLKYDKTHFSEKFYLVKPTSFKFFNTSLNGIYNWRLPEIKEYRVDKVIVYFEDFFQFFSFAITIDTSSNFYTKPVTYESKIMEAFPRKTEDTATRIEEIKKVEGEHINYKNFESNDDVRRIVWKIYAKNKELVVRIPEILDPYASHIYLYASFFSAFDFLGNDAVEVPFLNYYKTICWSVYKQLSQKGFDVRYVYDQDIPQHKMNSDEEQIKYAISVSKWQRDKELKSYVQTKDASVVIISSLTDINEVNELIEKYGNEISFVFVPLTDSLQKQHLGDWIQWLFVQQEKDAIAKYKTNWSLSLLRLKIAKNEKQLKLLLDKYDKSTVLGKIG